jgi:hypothetical protein
VETSNEYFEENFSQKAIQRNQELHRYLSDKIQEVYARMDGEKSEYINPLIVRRQCIEK